MNLKELKKKMVEITNRRGTQPLAAKLNPMDYEIIVRELKGKTNLMGIDLISDDITPPDVVRWRFLRRRTK